MWVTVGKGDTVRIYDIPRIVTFDSSWHHVRTENEVRGFFLQREVVPFDNGAYVALGAEPLMPRQARPIHLQRSRDQSRALNKIQTSEEAGRLRVLASTHDGGVGGRFWFAQFSLIDFAGYDLYLADTTGTIRHALRRRPAWWHREKISLAPAPTGTSRVVAIREISPNVVAVLVAHPIANWRAIPIDPKSFAGTHSWYNTVIELIDVRAGKLIGQVRAAGYPTALMRNRRFAIYRELPDGTPTIEVLSY
jgi:hypothetical protein